MNKKNDIIGVVLAAGLGKRMKSELPKVLHSVSGLPMVNLVIRALKGAGIKKVIVVVSFPSTGVKKIFNKKLPADVITIDQGKPLGTGHAVSSIKKKFKNSSGKVVIACGDMPLIRSDTINELIKKHNKTKASCTILTGCLNDPKGYGRIIRDNLGNIIDIAEDTDVNIKQKNIAEINSGMYCFSSGELFKVLPLINNKNKQKEYYLTDTIKLLSEQNKKVESFIVEDVQEILGVTSRLELSIANMIMNNRIQKKHMENGVTIIDMQSTFIDTRAKIGKDTIIEPFTVIDGNVTIGKNCVIGPFTHLRDKAFIKDEAEIGNFVEVKKTVVGKKSKAKHLTYLGDTEIGTHVNIGAGTITANYDGKNKFKTIIKDNAFIGSHSTLVAPVSIGKRAITGAGCVVLRNRNVPDNGVVVGIPAHLLKK